MCSTNIIQMLIDCIFLCLILCVLAINGAQICPYYGPDRFAAPEPNLANCSWFTENACCKRTEVTSVFAEMFVLFQATPECESRVSYLMCYFCSPDQEIWFRDNQKATICRSFCDSIFEHSAEAMYNNERIRDIFTDRNLADGGFCKDNFFDVVDSEKDCYKFDPKAFEGGQSALSSSRIFVVLLLGLVWHAARVNAL